MTEKQIIDKLSKASFNYYNGLECTLTDTAFDTLYDELLATYPNSQYLKVVGASAIGKKIKHKNSMISMGKTKDFEGFYKWANKVTQATNSSFRYTCTFKLDGLSGKATYVNGIISKLCTRGDGNIGQDISYLIPYLNIVKTLVDVPDYFEVDGEIILPKDNGVYTTKLRSMAAGIVNRESDLSEAHLLHFVAFNELPDTIQYTVTATYTHLETLGFTTTGATSADSPREVEQFFISYEETLREALNYETDGIVIWVDDKQYHYAIDQTWVVSHHHHYNIAWKPESEELETTLEEIQWNLSSQGRMIPKAIFTKIVLGGANHDKATLNNMRNVINLALIPGNRIVVSKRNDIIPCVEENLDKDEYLPIDIPMVCPSCGTVLDVGEVDLTCPNKEYCPGQHLKRIVKFVKELQPDGIGEGIVTSLYHAKVIASIPDLLSITRDNLVGLAGFKKAKIDNVLAAIDTMKHISFVDLINALTIHLVGKKALAKLNITTLGEFMTLEDNGSAISKSIIDWRSKSHNEELLSTLTSIIDIQDHVSLESQGIVVLTGKAHKGRKDLEQELHVMGYVMGKSVTKETMFVVTDDVNGSSSKLVKARKNGVDITTYEEFFK